MYNICGILPAVNEAEGRHNVVSFSRKSPCNGKLAQELLGDCGFCSLTKIISCHSSNANPCMTDFIFALQPKHEAHMERERDTLLFKLTWGAVQRTLFWICTIIVLTFILNSAILLHVYRRTAGKLSLQLIYPQESSRCSTGRDEEVSRTTNIL